MATILYRCDTCEREIALVENLQGITVFSKCVITEGCKGTLYKLSRNPNIIREDLDFPPVVPNLQDYTPRRVFYEEKINISTNPWKINHNLGVAPAVTVYFFDEDTGNPVEVAPNEYTITIIDKDNLNVTFGISRRGIVHLVARSSVPEKVPTVPVADDLFQVSHLGYLNFAVVSLINTPTSIRFLTEDNFDLDVEVLVPSSTATNVQGTYLKDTLDSSSPWAGWTQVLLRKRRNFATKSLQVLDIISDAFPTVSSLSDIPDGTSFEIQKIRYRNVGGGYLGSFINIEPRELMLLLANPPYGTVDKIRDRIVDVGELLVSETSRFFVYGGEVFLDSSNIERIYPRIEKASSDNLLNTPTPTVTPTQTVTPTETPPGTPPSTPASTPPNTPPSTPPGTPGSTPPSTPASTPPNTPASTPPSTPPNTPGISVTPDPTPPVTPTPTPEPPGLVGASLVDYRVEQGDPVANAQASVSFETNGTVTSSFTGTTETTKVIPSAWISTAPDAGIGNEHEIESVVTSGSLSGATGSGNWTTLSSASSLSTFLASGSGDTKSGQATVEIRNISNPSLTTGPFTVFLYAEVDDGGTPTGCFTAGNLVTMNDGTAKAIENIVSGDIVLGQDNVENVVTDNIVSEFFNENIYGINGSRSFFTAAHPFLTTDGWKAIDAVTAQKRHPSFTITQLEVGDTLVKRDVAGNQFTEEVTSLNSETKGSVVVYSLKVSGVDTPGIDGNDTYIVNDYVVHNK